VSIPGEDALVVEGVAGIENENPTKIISTLEVPDDTLRVLAGAHALHMGEDKELVGDPLEIAIMNGINWTIKGDHCSPIARSKNVKNFKIEKKFHFSSAKARMSTLLSYEGGTGEGAKYTAVVKVSKK
jgi:cation-transporting ATPase 13A1